MSMRHQYSSCRNAIQTPLPFCYRRMARGRRIQLRCEGLVAAGLVALSSQQTCDGDVLVQGLPMQAAAADPNLFALLRSGMQKSREPCEWHADNSTVAEIDPHTVWIEMHSRWADVDLCRFSGRTHSMPSRSGLYWPRRFPAAREERGRRNHHCRPLGLQVSARILLPGRLSRRECVPAHAAFLRLNKRKR